VLSNFFSSSGGILFLGLLSSYIFDKTGIPEVIILMSLGVLLGPVFHIFPIDSLHAISPFIGTLALIVILFDGGLGLDFVQLPKQFTPAIFLTITTFTLTLLAIAGGAHFVLRLPWMTSVLLGAILCSAPSVVIAVPLISQMKVSPEVKTVVKLESTIADVLAIVVSVSLIRVISLGTHGEINVMPEILRAFVLALVIGTAAGLIWLKLLNIFKGHPLSYMLTFGTILLLYGFVEWIGGAGGIAVLTFATVLSNAEQFFSRWGLHEHFVADSKIHGFHNEISFLIRIFFFVYLGMLFGVKNMDFTFFIGTILIVTIVIGIRYVNIQAFAALFSSHREDSALYFYMIPRGLATAVLAGMPIAKGIPNTEHFMDYAFALILISTLFMTFGILKIKKKQRKKEKEENIPTETFSAPPT